MKRVKKYTLIIYSKDSRFSIIVFQLKDKEK